MRKTSGFTLIAAIIIVMLIGIMFAGIVPQIVQNLILGNSRVRQAQTIYGAEGGIMFGLYLYRKYGVLQELALENYNLSLPSGLTGRAAYENSNFIFIDSSKAWLASGNKNLTGWTIKNIHRYKTLTVTHITVDWEPNAPNERVMRIRLGGTWVWWGNVKSGQKFKLKKKKLFSALAPPVTDNRAWFNINMGNKTVFLTFHFSDGSSYRTQLYPPGKAELQLKSTAKVNTLKRSIQARYDTLSTGAITKWEEVYDHYNF